MPGSSGTLREKLIFLGISSTTKRFTWGYTERVGFLEALRLFHLTLKEAATLH